MDERVRSLFIHAGAETDSNLQFVRDMLTKKAFNREAVLKTYAGCGAAAGPGSGARPGHVVAQAVRRRPAPGRRARVRNAIYEQVFDEHWVRDHLQLNINWRRRLARLASVLLVLTVLVTIPLAIFAWRQRAEAEHQASVALLERDQAMRQREIAENSLANVNSTLKAAQDALDALKRVDPASAAVISPRVDSAREEAQKNMAELTANIRGDRNDGPHKDAINARAAPARTEPAAPPARPSAQDAEVLRTLRQYQSAYASRNVDAVRRVQVLTPAETQALRDMFADTLAYSIVIDNASIQFAPDGRTATVSARMTRDITTRSGFNKYTDVPKFAMEKRGSAWMIVGVANVR